MSKGGKQRENEPQTKAGTYCSSWTWRERERERERGKRRVRCPKGGKRERERERDREREGKETSTVSKGGKNNRKTSHKQRRGHTAPPGPGLQKLPLPRLCSAGIASLGLPSGDRDGRGRTLEARLGCEKSPPPKKREREIEIEIERGGGGRKRVRCPKGRKRREIDKKIEVKDNDFIDCELKQTKGNERYKE